MIHSDETVELSESSVQDLVDRYRRHDLALRSSPQRKDHLERTARLISNERVTVTLGDQSWSRRPGRPREFDVQIDQTEQPQPITGLDEEIWHLFFQETVLFHELGHVLFTDFDELKERSDTLANEESRIFSEIFQKIFNGIEDGYIESHLPLRFDCYEDLLMMNANITTHIKQEKDEYHSWGAVMAGLLDNGFFDSGRWDDIYEERVDTKNIEEIQQIAPAIEYVVDRALETHDCSERIDLAVGLTRLLTDRLPAPDIPEMKVIVPEDWEEMSGGQLTELSDDVERAEAEMDGDEITGSSGERDIEEIIEDSDREKDVNRQRKDLNERRQRGKTPEIEQLEDMVDSDGAGDGDLSGDIHIPDWRMKNPQNASEAEEIGREIAHDFERALRHERSSTTRYGRRRGRLDSGSAGMIATGRETIFKTEDREEEKDYNCVILLDRSGSMGGGNIRAAQKATGAIAFGMYEAEIDVSVISFRGDHHHLELPFGRDPKDRKHNIFSSVTGGGTPSGQALEIALESVGQGEKDHDFVIIVTDGRPGDKVNYRRVLSSSDVPICGVYIGGKRMDLDSYFDTAKRAMNSGEVFEKTREFAEDLVLSEGYR